MTRPRHFKTDSKYARDSLLRSVESADLIHENEKKLINMLCEIDQQRFYVCFGYKSLMGFCNSGLKFSKTQSQRIVTLVRRSEPTSKLRIENPNQQPYKNPGNKLDYPVQ